MKPSSSLCSGVLGIRPHGFLQPRAFALAPNGVSTMKFLRRKQVLEKTSLSKTALQRHVDAGTIRAPIKLKDPTGRVHHNSPCVWLEEWVDQWMLEQASRSDS